MDCFFLAASCTANFRLMCQQFRIIAACRNTFLHRRYIDALGVVTPGARTLEVGCGNGSISAWLAKRVSPDGTAVAVDLDLSLVHVRMPNLELRKADIVAGPVERGTFDLVTARAVLHHLADAQAAIANMAVGLKPGGAILLIEPDFPSVLLSL
jgi:ubiquinone/menaquinone biosynthesis C-methylase UbiE